MRRILILFFVLNSWAVDCFGQILYQLENPAGTERLFLLGTFHKLPNRVHFQLDPIIDSLIEVSDVIFSEHFGNTGDPRYLDFLEDFKILAKESSIESSFTKTERKELFKFFIEEYRISPKLLRKYQSYHPYFFYDKIFDAVYQPFKMDVKIFEKARILEKEIIVLDDYEILIRAIGILKKSFDKNWLQNDFQGQNNFQDNFNGLLTAYLSQDTTAIWKFNQEQIRWFKKDYEWLIGGRNEAWLKSYAKNKRSVNFMFAGMGHLVAPRVGLLDLFKEKGYQITPIPIQTIF